MSVPYAKLPRWADYGLIPLLNLVVAFLVAGLVVLLVGRRVVAGPLRDQGCKILLEIDVGRRRARWRPCDPSAQAGAGPCARHRHRRP